MVRLLRCFKYTLRLLLFFGFVDVVSVLLFSLLMKLCYIKYIFVRFRRVSRKIFFERNGIDKYRFCGN